LVFEFFSMRCEVLQDGTELLIREEKVLLDHSMTETALEVIHNGIEGDSRPGDTGASAGLDNQWCGG
jgi:hypothetical protein